MKKLILSLTAITVFGLSIKLVSATENTGTPVTVNQPNVTDSVRALYNSIDFSGAKQPLSFEAFATAYKGYQKLMQAGKLNLSKPLLTIADLSLSSTLPRLWVINLYPQRPDWTISKFILPLFKRDKYFIVTHCKLTF